METDLKTQTVLIIEDSYLFATWLEAALSEQNGITVTGKTDNIRDTIVKVFDLQPDVVILDLSLKDGNGMEVIKAIRSGKLNIRIIVYTSYSIFREHCLSLGADSFFDKFSDSEEVIDAIVSNSNKSIRQTYEFSHLPC